MATTKNDDPATVDENEPTNPSQASLEVPAPSVALSINDATESITLSAGALAAIRWTSSNGSSMQSTYRFDSAACDIPQSGAWDLQGLNGARMILIPKCYAGHRITFTLSVTNAQGLSVESQVTLTVPALPPEQPSVPGLGTPANPVTGNSGTGFGSSGTNSGSGGTNTGTGTTGGSSTPVTNTPMSGSFIYSLAGTHGFNYNVKNIFVDLFDTSSAQISNLKKAGRKVICYFSAGTAENWRPDYSRFPASVRGDADPGWEGEVYLDYRSSSVRSVMASRINLAASKGCNGIDPDNVDTHETDTGFSLKASDQLSYMKFLAAQGHAKNLLVGLKNSADTARNIEPYVDFVVAEECFKYGECSKYKSFTQHGKAMFVIEYRSASSSNCSQAAAGGFSVIFSNLALTSFQFCN